MPIKTNIGNGVSTLKDTAMPSDVRFSKTFHAGKGSKPKVGEIPDCEIRSVKPKAVETVIPAGSYISEDIHIAGDENLKADNIKAGVAIFGQAGKKSVVDTENGNLVGEKMAKGQVGYSRGAAVSGELDEIQPEDVTIPAGGSRNIQKGIHAGSGIVRAQSLEDATKDTTMNSSGQMLEGVTAVSKGKVYEGSMPNNGGIGTVTLAAGESEQIPYGFTEGGTVKAKTLAEQTGATAAANQIAANQTAWVNGVKVTGSLAERGQAQYGTPALTASYLAINALPEGIYRKNGASWAPEARCDINTLRAVLGINAARILSGTTMCGVAGTLTCNSIINFSPEAYNGRQVKLKWQNPYVSSGKPFAGVFINYAETANPGYGGTRIYTGYGSNTAAGGWSEVIVTMPRYRTTYYFSCTAYVSFYVSGTWLTDSYGNTIHSGAVRTLSSCDCGDCSDRCDGCGGDCGGNCDSSVCCQGG